MAGLERHHSVYGTFHLWSGEADGDRQSPCCPKEFPRKISRVTADQMVSSGSAEGNVEDAGRGAGRCLHGVTIGGTNEGEVPRLQPFL